MFNKSIYHIVTTPGENTNNSIVINWHSLIKNSYLLLSNDNFKTYNKYIPNSEILWDMNNIDNIKDDSFKSISRYVCNVKLTLLIPNTTYYYKIINEEDESSIYSFKTTGNNDFDIFACVDLQHPFNKETPLLINNLCKISPNTSILLCSGDLTGCACVEDEWSYILDNNLFNNLIVGSGVGDHEYWGDTFPNHIPMTKEPYAFNHLFSNPKNGCSSLINSNYYFYINNVLVIVFNTLDSNTTISNLLNEQLIWFDNIMNKLKNTYDYSIVLMHKSIYGSKIIDSSVVKNMKEPFNIIFNKYHVDLVISGHDHIYSRTSMINNTTYYLDMGSSGNKRRDVDDSLLLDSVYEKILDIKNNNQTIGSIIHVNKDFMEINVYDQTNYLVDKFTIYKK